MSWSVTKNDVPKDLIEQEVDALHRDQSAYQHEPHRRAMDAFRRSVGEIAVFAAPGQRFSVTSYGHLNDDGTGSCTLSVSIGHAPPAP